MIFSTEPFIPATSSPRESAAIAIIVIIQFSIEVANKSVGENDSPFPLLSTGASVTRVSPDGPWVAVHRSPPS